MTTRRRQLVRLANESEGGYQKNRAVRRKPKQLNWWLIRRISQPNLKVMAMTAMTKLISMVLIRWMLIAWLRVLMVQHLQQQNLGKEVPQGMSMVPLIPFPVGMAKDQYEFQVMDIYINAKGWKICHWKVCDEYFGNDKGSGFFI